MITLVAGVAVFSGIILLLSVLLHIAKIYLTGGAQVNIQVNNARGKSFAAKTGGTLLEALHQHQLFIASGCGGKGVCGECKVAVHQGGGVLLVTETPLVSRAEAKKDLRLACQVKVKQNMVITLPDDCLHAQALSCKVISNQNLATFIKELILELPEPNAFNYQAGEYIQIICPPYQVNYRDFDIGRDFRQRWNDLDLWRYQATNSRSTTRSYSLASFPLEKNILKLNVRIAPPPAEFPKAPPGVVSSYLFSLKPGQRLDIIGPHGKMHVHNSDAEMLFIGGGAGMAPMRSLLMDQLLRQKTRRKISFWYGARSLREAFYRHEFNELADKFEHFHWTLALSAPQAEDHWQGARGFIHQVALDLYLNSHKAPEDIEYYLCGPAEMIDACCAMLDELGVEPENIRFDQFG